MTLKKKHLNIVYSFLTVLGWTALVFFFAYPNDDPEFGMAVYLIYTLYFGLVFGAIALGLRFLKMVPDKSNFFYVLPGVLNVCTGIFGIILCIVGALDTMWIERFSLALLLGAFIIAEVLRDKGPEITDADEAD